ncbi:hypothetical protein [Streptomyces sp. MJM1172]|uniref:hypothetical protein n=1 Tax=Streptomyces sp. MJM1172 TaxID=1703926 RepID=UPI00093B9686|nr:hypothetical protein [Streptomyces sp. MJM1172]OKI50312.1 hypothetical protein AMK15_32655 [Streptomyces sp. MJM1172]
MAYLRNLLTRRAKPAPTDEPNDNQPSDGEGSCESFMWEPGDLWRCRSCDTVNATEEDQRCQACDTPAPSQR